jgi:hypothetical protein
MKGNVNYSGWIPMRRGIVEHLINRSLTMCEFAVLSVLIMLADKESGSYTINVPTLKYYLPELTDDIADRTLRSLDKKRYIFRKITYKSKIAYPYWIEGFVPTFGPNKARRLDLSEVFASKDISRLRYSDPAAEGAAEDADEGQAEGADSNEKREVRVYMQELPLTNKEAVASTRAPAAPELSTGVSSEAHACPPRGAHSAAPEAAARRTDGAHAAASPKEAEVAISIPSEERPDSLVLDVGFRDMTTGKPINVSEVIERCTKAGLDYDYRIVHEVGTHALLPIHEVEKRIGVKYPIQEAA